MKDRVVRAVFAAVVVACECGSAWADIPASAYVQDGLIAQWDGIDNAGTGKHDPSATTWKELVGDLPTTATALTFADGNHAVFNGTTTSGTLLTGSLPAALEAISNGAFTADIRMTPVAYKQYGGMFHFDESSTTRYFSLSSDKHAASGGKDSFFGSFQYKRDKWDAANGYSLALPVIGRATNVTAIADGGNHKLYLGGALISTHNAGTVVKYASTQFSIGRYLLRSERAKMNLYGVRFYNRVLAADDIAWNAKVDRARFEGDPSGYICDVEKRSIKTRVRLQAKYGAEISLDGGETWGVSYEDWYELDSPVTVQMHVPEGSAFSWNELPAGATLSEDGKTMTFAADKPISASAQVGEKITWNHHTNNSTCYWEDETKWTCPDGSHRVPAAYDTVVIPDRTSYPYNGYTIISTNPLPPLTSFYLGTRRTLSLRNGWDSKIDAERIVIKGEKGDSNFGTTLTCGGGFTEEQMSNRVWIVADELVLSNAYSYITSGGYGACNGEAWHGETGMAESDCGSHGGKGTSAHSHTYGSITAPTAPGSGSWRTSSYKQNGGGAVRLQVKHVVVNGSINATGTGGSFGWGGGAGSGGSIYISCDTIEGTGSVNANGGGNTSSSASGAGGGGRVSVVYDPVKQAAVDCKVAFAARGGCNWTASTARYTVGYSGTLYFPDDQFLNRPGRMLAGWVYYGPEVTLANSLVGENLALTNSLVELTTGAVVNVTGNLSFDGTNTRVNGLRTSDVDIPITVGGNLTLTGARVQITKGSTVTVGGNLVLDEGSSINSSGELYVKAAATNGTEAAGYVDSVTVGGDWRIGKNALASIICDSTTGSIVPLSAKTFTLEAGGFLSANAGGWGTSKAPGYNSGYGGSHGGLGAATYGGYPTKKDGSLDTKYLYGNMKRPLLPGSSGGNTSLLGGGVIWLKTAGKMDVNGTISANGSNNGGWASAGSGGSVYLQAGKIAGSTNGTITAKGGSSTTTYGYGAGGGGRIALWYHTSSFGDVNPTNVITFSAAGGAGLVAVESDKKDGLPGSIYVHQIPGLRVFVR